MRQYSVSGKRETKQVYLLCPRSYFLDEHLVLKECNYVVHLMIFT